MTGMSRYYISRVFISAAFGGLFALTGSPWWMAVPVSVVLIALFLYAPHSGRYAVHPELGVTALQRDERTQTITDRAARNAFVVTALVIAGITVYFGAISSASVPVVALQLTLAVAALTYFLSDFWLRRS
jgi:uncharacterized membrane protein